MPVDLKIRCTFFLKTQGFPKKSIVNVFLETTLRLPNFETPFHKRPHAQLRRSRRFFWLPQGYPSFAWATNGKWTLSGVLPALPCHLSTVKSITLHILRSSSLNVSGTWFSSSKPRIKSRSSHSLAYASLVYIYIQIHTLLWSSWQSGNSRGHCGVIWHLYYHACCAFLTAHSKLPSNICTVWSSKDGQFRPMHKTRKLGFPWTIVNKVTVMFSAVIQILG